MLLQDTAIIVESPFFKLMPSYLLAVSRNQPESATYNGSDLTRQVVVAVGNSRSGESSKTVSISIFMTSLSSRRPSMTSSIIWGNRNLSDSYLGIAFKVRNTTIYVNDMDFLTILSHRLSAAIETYRFFENIDKKSHHNYSGNDCCGKSAAGP
jgi:hypothetical protein